MDGRRVILFKQRPGADRRLATLRSQFRPHYGRGDWGMPRVRHGHDRVYAKVTPRVHDEFVCGGDRSGPLRRHGLKPDWRRLQLRSASIAFRRTSGSRGPRRSTPRGRATFATAIFAT
jgi:hypothetical protein